MTERRILGIDPGITGGLVIIDEKALIIEATPIPTYDGKIIDLKELNFFLNEFKPTEAYIEHVSAMPKQGVVSMFNFGRTFGMLEAAIAAKNIPYQLLRPQAWQKVMHVGVEKSIDSKARSLIIFKRLYPTTDLKASGRCRKDHDGMVDALMIALYGQRNRNCW